MKQKEKFALYLKNLVFGAEDSLVSTVGLLSGIVVAGVSESTIILTGIILIFVEAFSMGIGSLLSEHGSQEFIQGREIPLRDTYKSAVIMFLSYFTAGFIPLSPYLFVPAKDAIWISVGLTLIALFLLGAISARFYRIKVFKHGVQMFLIGGSAVVIGVFVGNFLKGF